MKEPSSHGYLLLFREHGKHAPDTRPSRSLENTSLSVETKEKKVSNEVEE